MNIKSAEFVKGIVDDEILGNGIPQVAFIGRSNVGKSSVINSLVNRQDLARSSAKPGKTREINLFLINKDFYLVDLPGYGFAEGSLDERQNLKSLIQWYFKHPHIAQRKVVLIIDAKVGMTESDSNMLRLLHQYGKNVVVIANKIDILKKADLKKQIQKIEKDVSFYNVIPYSAEKKIGVQALMAEILK
jgi:GTP-binding protein